MTNYPTPVKIAAGPLYDALRLQSVLTIETIEAALYEHVYKLWEARGMFGCQCHESNAEFAAHMLTALRDSAAAIDRRAEAGQ